MKIWVLDRSGETNPVSTLKKNRKEKKRNKKKSNILSQYFNLSFKFPEKL